MPEAEHAGGAQAVSPVRAPCPAETPPVCRLHQTRQGHNVRVPGLPPFLTMLPSPAAGRVTGGAAGPRANVTGTQVSLQREESPQTTPSVHIP